MDARARRRRAPLLWEPPHESHLRVRAEYDVFAGLWRLGFRCHLPRYIDHGRRDSRNPRALVIVVLIAGFVLVQFDRSADSWRRITAEPGVKRLLGPSSEYPTPAKIGEVERLIALGRAGDGRRWHAIAAAFGDSPDHFADQLRRGASQQPFPSRRPAIGARRSAP